MEIGPLQVVAAPIESERCGLAASLPRVDFTVGLFQGCGDGVKLDGNVNVRQPNVISLDLKRVDHLYGNVPQGRDNITANAQNGMGQRWAEWQHSIIGIRRVFCSGFLPLSQNPGYHPTTTPQFPYKSCDLSRPGVFLCIHTLIISDAAIARSLAWSASKRNDTDRYLYIYARERHQPRQSASQGRSDAHRI